MSTCQTSTCQARRRMTSRAPSLQLGEVTSAFQLNDGTTLEEASNKQALVLVFMRHFGCTFTRQLLRGLEQLQEDARKNGARLVLVHMLGDGKEKRYIGDGDVSSISDPKCRLYRAFGLGKGGPLELFGPRVWWLGMKALFQGCGVGKLAGNGLQMPGAFVFHRGEIIAAQRAETAADLPDLPSLFDGAASASQ